MVSGESAKRKTMGDQDSEMLLLKKLQFFLLCLILNFSQLAGT